MARAKKDSIEAYNAPFPVRLRELMEQNKCTQADLAQATGRTRQTVSQYTTGMSEPGYDVLVKIALYFDVTTDYLLGLTDDPAPNPTAVDGLGLSPQAVQDLQWIRARDWKDPLDGFASDMILGTMHGNDAWMSYLGMMDALKLPNPNFADGMDPVDFLCDIYKFRGEVSSRGYAVLTAEESFRYHAEKVGQALTRWLIDTYQDQGAWNRKEEQQHGID